jgi:hypothetical protein
MMAARNGLAGPVLLQNLAQCLSWGFMIAATLPGRPDDHAVEHFPAPDWQVQQCFLWAPVIEWSLLAGPAGLVLVVLAGAGQCCIS